MLKYICTLVPILSIAVFLNIRAWHKTGGEVFVDPLTWIGAAIVLVLGIILTFWERKERN
jgi:hypothetical protein